MSQILTGGGSFWLPPTTLQVQTDASDPIVHRFREFVLDGRGYRQAIVQVERTAFYNLSGTGTPVVTLKYQKSSSNLEAEYESTTPDNLATLSSTYANPDLLSVTNIDLLPTSGSPKGPFLRLVLNGSGGTIDVLLGLTVRVQLVRSCA